MNYLSEFLQSHVGKNEDGTFDFARGNNIVKKSMKCSNQLIDKAQKEFKERRS